jgi:hypothetical protein
MTNAGAFHETRLYMNYLGMLDTCRRSSAWESTRPDMFRSEAEDRAVVSSNLTDGIFIFLFGEIVKNHRVLFDMKMFLQALYRVFCAHKESFSFRTYDEFNFKEYNKCSRCGKTLRYLRGFEEDIRG